LNLKKYVRSDLKPISITDAFYLEKEDSNAKIILNNIAEKREVVSKNQYFKDKEQIFQFAIKHVTENLFSEYKLISRDENLSYEQKLKKICADVIKKSYYNKPFIISLVDFLFQMKRRGNDYSENIKRRTLRLDYMFSVLINQGKRVGEFKDVPVAETVAQIFAMIESFAFQMVLLDSFVPEYSINLLTLFIDSITVEQN
jgi:hypothetical protein